MPIVNSYEWKITNASQLVKNSHCLSSGRFSCQLLLQDGQKVVKDLGLWLVRDKVNSDNGNNEQLSPFLRLILTTEKNSHRNISWVSRLPRDRNIDTRNVCFAWISAAGRRQCISRLLGGFHAYRGDEFAVAKCNFVFYRDLFKEDKNLLVEDTLTIVCEVHGFIVNSEYVDSWLVHPAKSVVGPNTEHTLNKDLRRILETGQGSDVTIAASDGREFAAHTVILSSRTAFFAKMFEHNMQEKQEHRVTINDLDSNAVEALLEFMYTDEVSNITQTAVKLLPKADEYDIPRLKVLCEKAMAPQLSSATAAEYLFLADLHSALQLREAAKYFIALHWNEVTATHNWKQLISDNLPVIHEITDIMAGMVM